MKKRPLILFALAFLVGAVMVFPASRLCLWGWLRGEVCYEGRPVSYWRWKLEEWEELRIHYADMPWDVPAGWVRRPSVFQQVNSLVRGEKCVWDGLWEPEPFDPNDVDCVPLLIELLKVHDPTIQHLACISLRNFFK